MCHCGQEGDGILACITKGVASRWRRLSCSLLCPREVTSEALCLVLSSLVQESQGFSRGSPAESHKVARELEHLLYEESLGDLRLFSLKKIGRGFYHAYKYLKESNQVDLTELSNSIQCQNKGQWAHTETQKCPYEHDEKFLDLKVRERWNRMPGKVMESPSLDIVKTCMDTFLYNLL